MISDNPPGRCEQYATPRRYQLHSLSSRQHKSRAQYYHPVCVCVCVHVRSHTHSPLKYLADVQQIDTRYSSQVNIKTTNYVPKTFKCIWNINKNVTFSVLMQYIPNYWPTTVHCPTSRQTEQTGWQIGRSTVSSLYRPWVIYFAQPQQHRPVRWRKQHLRMRANQLLSALVFESALYQRYHPNCSVKIIMDWPISSKFQTLQYYQSNNFCCHVGQ